MRFLNTDALYTLLIATGILVLYVLRMPRKRSVFPSVLILKTLPEALRSKRERRRLRTVLSAALQILILALIVLACARPYVSTRGLSDREIIVLLDRSASMKTLDEERHSTDDEAEPGKITRFDKAREVVRGLVRDMDIGDRMLLMAFDSQAEVVVNFAGNKAVLRQALRDLVPADTATNIAPAVKLVQQVTKALEHPEVYVISDGSFEAGGLAELKSNDLSLIAPSRPVAWPSSRAMTSRSSTPEWGRKRRTSVSRGSWRVGT